jgi:hypothetical protein
LAPATAGLGAAATAIVGCALLFSNGSSPDPLVWIGGAAILAAGLAVAAIALGALPAPSFSAPALAFLGCLGALAVWMGVSVVWSAEPGSSWSYTNRMLAYVAFAFLGLVLGSLLPRAPELVAGTLAGLLALVFGWALLAKAVPALYSDYGRIARLRSPVEYWNELALLADVGVALALWLAAPRTRRPEFRAAGVALLYAALLVAFLTYSRFGIVLALVVAAAWTVLSRDRVESLAAVALAGVPALAVFLFALSLPGVSDDGQTHAQRVHDGWRFGLAAAAGLVLVGALALAAARFEARRPLDRALRVRVERLALWAVAAGAVVAVVLAVVFAGRIWDQFANEQQVTNAGQRLTKLGSSNRWTWWQQSWDAFTAHPLGGTGAATFDLTNRLHRTSSFDIATEPHNVPLQLLSETGIVGLALFLGAAAAAIVGILQRRRSGAAVTALGLGLAAWLAHMVVDIDWNYVAVCGPLLLAAGAVLGGGPRPAPVPERRRRPLLAAAGIVVAGIAIYSLTTPWLATRALRSSADALGRGDLIAARADAKDATGYDPLSVDALLQRAALAPEPQEARRLYRKAVNLEPLNPDAWYELGTFEYIERNWVAAYQALDRSWGLDRHGPAAVPCDYLDLVRPRVTGYGVKCRGFREPARP